MAYDEDVAYRIRAALAEQGGVTEKKMFGGLAFMVNGHMCCGLAKGELMVRVGPDQYAESLAQPHAREMDFTGKPLSGMVYVEPAGFADDADLALWLERCAAFVLAAEFTRNFLLAFREALLVIQGYGLPLPCFLRVACPVHQVLEKPWRQRNWQ